MRAVVQRVRSAAVDVGGERVAEIGCGLLALVGVATADDASDAEALARKIVGLRVFEDEQGRMNRSLTDVEGALCVVSQFTLLGETKKGRRPSFGDAAPPERAEALVAALVDRARSLGVPVATGRFRSHMEVSLVNDGPVTLWIDTRA